MDIVTTEAGYASRIHHALHKIIALHPILVSRSIWKMRERRLAQLVFFQFPEVLEIETDVETHRPIVILAFNGTLYRLALGVALNAHVVSLDKTEPSRIDDVGSRRPGDVGASRTV